MGMSDEEFTIAGYGPIESEIIYKLWNKGFVGQHQVKDEGLDTIAQSSTGAETQAEIEASDAALETLKNDGVIVRYQSGRQSWVLDKTFVNQVKDELEEEQANRAGVSRIL